MRKNHRNKVATKFREVAGIEPESDVWVVADEPRYDHMATVARDARTLLGALTANVDWLRSGLRDQAAGDLLEGIADIEACCERLNNMLEDALLGTRQNGITVRRGMLSIGSVLNASLKQVRRAADAKRITIEVVTDSDVAAMLDRALVTRAIAKLLERIVGDNEEGARIVIRYQLEGDDISVAFARDDGNLRSLSASNHPLRPGRPRAYGADIDFCHIVAESHGGSLTVSAGLTLYRLVLPWVGPNTL